MSLTESAQQQLLTLAWDTIHYGLQTGRLLPIHLNDYSAELLPLRATFVTLEHQQQLRGCMGHLIAQQPLVADVVANAYAAAFQDPRFPPLNNTELAVLTVHISILSPATAMTFCSEQDLLAQLQPGVDGLILEYAGRQATFLPSVWESLPTRSEFLTHLKLKAGLEKNFWSDQIRAYRYHTEAIPPAPEE